MWYLSQNKQILGGKHTEKEAQLTLQAFRERMFTPSKRSWLILVMPTSYKGVTLPFSGRPVLTGNRRYSYAFSKTPRLRPVKRDWHFISTERTQKRGPQQGSFITVLHLPRNAGILERKLHIAFRFQARIPTRAVQNAQLCGSVLRRFSGCSFVFSSCTMQPACSQRLPFLQESLLIRSHVDGSPG